MSPSEADEKKDEPGEEDHPLRAKVEAIAKKSGAGDVAVAYYDYKTETGWSHNGERLFHAASTIKVPVLLGVFRAIEEDPRKLKLSLKSRVHVRNRFISAAGDRSAFSVSSERDANPEVQDAIGRTMRVEDLAHHMITTSSNLATNLLIEIVGARFIARTLRDLGLDRGVEFRRGVEDDAAHKAGIDNKCSADGMLAVLRAIEERKAFGDEASEAMLDILHKQVFRSGIPADLPDGVRVAHKTGEISTVAHDAGIVYPPKRAPYALVVLTEWDAEQTNGRKKTIARISRAVYDHLAGSAADG